MQCTELGQRLVYQVGQVLVVGNVAGQAPGLPTSAGNFGRRALSVFQLEVGNNHVGPKSGEHLTAGQADAIGSACYNSRFTTQIEEFGRLHSF